ncbi:MAG: endo-1,4-beta-xylanase [Planctomycetes bacterium]|nr:endo-1,4-beta-xylanase [Planctomycetota bacterium]
MLRFSVFCDGEPADSIDLAGAYLVASDGVPLRAEIEFCKGEIHCKKRAPGPAGLALPWTAKGTGRILLETTRLPERDKPYILQVELARGQLLRLSQKAEDWAVDDPQPLDSVSAKWDKGRDLFIDSLKADKPSQAARVADAALSLAVEVGEDLTRLHAQAHLKRRRRVSGFSRWVFGGSADTDTSSDTYRKKLTRAVDFVAVPFSWRTVEPAEQEFEWSAIDGWVDWLTRHSIPIRGSDLVNFTESNIPDWVYIWEHDFETIRDLVYEHIRRVINRYGSYIQVWDVISGIHGNNCMSFNFEELMELTRMSTAIAKQLAPRSKVTIELVAPWGEYYANNQRTIPPLLYAEMVTQAGINFDAFGLQFDFGAARDGTYLRDMFQISSVMDRFNVGRPLHITAIGVPSAAPEGGETAAACTGEWHGPWSERLQARWIAEFYSVALSKPFVETVSWKPMSDKETHPTPHCGLLRADLAPKPAYRELTKLRSLLSDDTNNGISKSA